MIVDSLGKGSNHHLIQSLFTTDRETDAQRGNTACLGSYGQVLLESKLEARLNMHSLNLIMGKYQTIPK